MDSSVKPLMVPWDFTRVSEYALEHAAKIARIDGNPVYLAHIAKKDEEVEKFRGILDTYSLEAFKKFNTRPKVLVKSGKLVSCISELIEEIKPEMVVMGTDGKKARHLFGGSRTLDVITHSTVPFVVVQSPPVDNNFEHIVLPVDFRKEDKEKVKQLVYLYQHFDSKIHIIKTRQTDKKLLHSLRANVAFTKKILDKHHVKYDVIVAPGKKSLAKETVDYAVSIKAELIVIMTKRSHGLTEFIFGPEEMSIINNSAKIPVMCINPRISKFSGSFSTMAG